MSASLKFNQDSESSKKAGKMSSNAKDFPSEFTGDALKLPQILVKMKTVLLILGFASICLSTVNAQSPSSIFGEINVLYLTKSLDYKDLHFNTIQWDYNVADRIQLISPSCNNPEFSPDTKTSAIRLLFNTNEYYNTAIKYQNYNFGVEIKCDGISHQIVQNWTQADHYINTAKPYTLVTLGLGKCTSGNVQEVRLQYDSTGPGTGNPKPYGGGQNGWKPIQSSPSCSSINNFKTLYWSPISA